MSTAVTELSRSILLALLLADACGGNADPPGSPPPGPAASAVEQMQALRAIKAAKTPLQQKIDSRLYLGLLHQRNDPRLASLTDFRFVEPEADGKLPVEVVVKAPARATAMLGKVAALGGTVKAVSRSGLRMTARVGLPDLESLAALPEVRRVRPQSLPMTNATNVSQGDAVHGASEARTFFGTDGTGVKVCAISDGVDSLADLQASGDLPAVVEVLTGQEGAGDEGSALLEIVHDLAPGATLGFATGRPDEATLAQNILDLAASDCDIIVDDIFYVEESPFQDGAVAQAVNTVTANGALYFSSAGDEGNTDDLTSGTWEGDFLASAAADPAPLAGANLHDFGNGGQSISVTFGSVDTPAVLIWAEHYEFGTGSASTDFDIYDMSGDLTTIFDASTDVQDGTGGDDFPFENISSGVFTGERLLIDKFAAGTTSSVPMLNLNVFRGALDSSLATAGATRGHSAAINAFSVAATPATTGRDGPPDGPFPDLFTATDVSEPFTSDGPRRIILDPTGVELTPGNRTSTGGVVRQKPDLTAADGVSCAAPGFDPFFGTSAAAAHAAAIAALLKSSVPTLTPAEVRTALVGSALDIEGAGVDRDTGAGIVMAHAALAAAGAVPVTTTVLESSLNPSTFGDAITLTATVTPSDATGSVSFMEGVTVLGDGTLSAGTATLELSSLSEGTHDLTAVYGGDGSFGASTSSPLSQVVNPAGADQPDAGAPPDAASPSDAAASAPDAAVAATPDAGGDTTEDGGCGCRTATRRSSSPTWLALLGLYLFRRARPRRNRHIVQRNRSRRARLPAARIR